MVIVTTMQNQEIINKKKSHEFYWNEYIDKLSSINYKPDINLQCLTDLSYNRGVMSTYKKAINFIESNIS